ncbi:hypothetical protein DL93DRAFT_2081192 [Clavulina sp. PMI_390]|nr:hypothetical protein DL93DRAFT_2081192 [Clavulina sp. PMI_390]
MSYSGKQGQYDRPYHSIDLESSPVQQQYAPPNEEQMPLSPRASAMPVPTMAGVQNSQYPPRPAFQQTSSSASHGKQTHKSNASWDVLGGMQKEWDNFDSRNASQAAFQYAEGDAPTTTFGKLYLFLLNTSIVTRWIIFIVPVLALLWIPGIISLTANKTASIWHVRLLWWSEWWSVLWVGWWAALAVAMSLPYFLRWTLGLGLPALRKYFDWLKALSRPLAFVGWSLAAFISYNPLIHNNMQTVNGVTPGSSANALTLIGRLLFGTVISAMILFGEKFGMQYVAYKFHETSYADRIQHQKKQLECLVILYRNSSHLDRNDTLRDGDARGGSSSNLNPTKLLKAALKGVQRTAETTTSAFGNLATEIAGVSVLQPNSPAGMVSAALNSANKSRLLARRLYYSFRAEGADRIVLGDISRFFPNREMATFAFEMFDKDENGDSTKEEMEAALLEINTERLSLAASMKDVDSATKRLDAILMTLYFFVVLLVFAVMLDASISTLVTGAGTFLLGLSWLIGGSAQEVLTSIIFLFIKHPFDIGDGIEVDGVSYSVKEIRLLSTLLVDGRGADVQCPNTVLNGKNIVNRRRSGPMSETFEFTVGYGTSFEQLEQLRHRMLKFIQVQRRDYMPVFDVMVGDISDQGSMKLKVDIKYKSNWQQGALKAQRRNKWICELKIALRELKIFGPSGDPNAAAGPQQVTMVPYVPPEPAAAPTPPAYDNRQYNLSDSHAALLNQGTSNIFGDEDTLKMPQAHPSQGDVGSATTSGYTTPAQVTMSQQEAVLRSRVPPAGPPAASAGTSGLRGMPAPQNQAPPQPTRWASAEEIEMKQTQQ